MLGLYLRYFFVFFGVGSGCFFLWGAFWLGGFCGVFFLVLFFFCLLFGIGVGGL